MTQLRAKPTLADVAQLAGVSTATVSRCLNSPDKVIEETRLKVITAVKKLNYSPNFGARVMAAKRSHTIGAVIPTMDNAIFARGLQAFQEELHILGYNLLVASSSYRADIEEEQIRSLISRGAEGLLLIGHDRAGSINTFLQQRNLPTVVAWTFDQDKVFPSVGFDNRAAMRALAEQVIALGHTKIGMISAPIEANDRARARFLGIQDALGAHNLSGTVLPLIETKYDVLAGGDAFEELIKSDIRPTAIMCGNDVLAAGAILRAKSLGLSVPQDVSITGFDDIELATIVEPSLTTVHVPHREMGKKAARLLVQMLEKNETASSEKLATFVQTRNSLAAPSI
ncbi:LacI family DNA-binding transcriptional regulator [Cognatishimia sp. WU-CL00825]|uniref:LacI family DNA-binding transcriptional regulator n=1 Tax=Cognatishimia sp. WU-CL00825 TaxID=3127658 RepID=UPI003365322E